MATDQQFCLRWNNHQNTLVSIFDSLLESGTLVDCTIAAEGRYLQAHKVVLSACSPYFAMLLREHCDRFPIIILKDIKYQELQAMMNYMYRGEVNITQDTLGSFLKAAESLQIRGLTDSGAGSAETNNNINGPVSNGVSYATKKTSAAAETRKLPIPAPERFRSPPPQPALKKLVKSLENHHPYLNAKSLNNNEPYEMPPLPATKRRKLLPPIKCDGLVVTPITHPLEEKIVAPPLSPPRADITPVKPAPVPVAPAAMPLTSVAMPVTPVAMPVLPPVIEPLVNSSKEPALATPPPPPPPKLVKSEQLEESYSEDTNDDSYTAEDENERDENARMAFGGPGTNNFENIMDRTLAGEGTLQENQVFALNQYWLNNWEYNSKYVRLTETNPFSCQHCGKRYRWKSTLKRHESFECGGKEPAHKCPHCDYRAKQSGNLRVHIRKYHTVPSSTTAVDLLPATSGHKLRRSRRLAGHQKNGKQLSLNASNEMKERIHHDNNVTEKEGCSICNLSGLSLPSMTSSKELTIFRTAFYNALPPNDREMLLKITNETHRKRTFLRFARVLNMNNDDFLIAWFEAGKRLRKKNLSSTDLSTLEEEFQKDPQLNDSRALLIAYKLNVHVSLVKHWFKKVDSKVYQRNLLFEEFLSNPVLTNNRAQELMNATKLPATIIEKWFTGIISRFQTLDKQKVLSKLNKSDAQLVKVLQRKYKSGRFITNMEARQLALKHGTTHEEILTWFCYRRAFELLTNMDFEHQIYLRKSVVSEETRSINPIKVEAEWEIPAIIMEDEPEVEDKCKILTPDQYSELINAFGKCRTPNLAVRSQLASQLDLPLSRVNRWFKERIRIKDIDLNQCNLQNEFFAKIANKSMSPEELDELVDRPALHDLKDYVLNVKSIIIDQSSERLCLSKLAENVYDYNSRFQLIKEYEENRFPSPAKVEFLAKELNMTVEGVQEWFTNAKNYEIVMSYKRKTFDLTNALLNVESVDIDNIQIDECNTVSLNTPNSTIENSESSVVYDGEGSKSSKNRKLLPKDTDLSLDASFHNAVFDEFLKDSVLRSSRALNLGMKLNVDPKKVENFFCSLNSRFRCKKINELYKNVHVTDEQLRVLEEEYQKTRYLELSQRHELSTKLAMSKTDVRFWFADRRFQELFENQSTNSIESTVLANTKSGGENLTSEKTAGDCNNSESEQENNVCPGLFEISNENNPSEAVSIEVDYEWDQDNSKVLADSENVENELTVVEHLDEPSTQTGLLSDADNNKRVDSLLVTTNSSLHNTTFSKKQDHIIQIPVKARRIELDDDLNLMNYSVDDAFWYVPKTRNTAVEINNITNEHTSVLEANFIQCRKVDSLEIAALSKQLGISEQKIFWWFIKRRYSEKIKLDRLNMLLGKKKILPAKEKISIDFTRYTTPGTCEIINNTVTLTEVNNQELEQCYKENKTVDISDLQNINIVDEINQQSSVMDREVCTTSVIDLTNSDTVISGVTMTSDNNEVMKQMDMWNAASTPSSDMRLDTDLMNSDVATASSEAMSSDNDILLIDATSNLSSDNPEPGAPKLARSVNKPKSSLTALQRSYLTKEFKKSRFVSDRRAQTLANDILMTPQAVKLWFSRKRETSKAPHLTAAPGSSCSRNRDWTDQRRKL